MSYYLPGTLELEQVDQLIEFWVKRRYFMENVWEWANYNPI